MDKRDTNPEMDQLAHLVRMLRLKRIDEHTFEGDSEDLGWGTLFGGHVLGQALSAAAQTVPEDRFVHSLHAYFMQAGRVDVPIRYTVERLRDGRSFLTRRITASQGDSPIFCVSASFHGREPGFVHQTQMPKVAPPSALVSELDLARNVRGALPEKLRKAALKPRAIEIRPIDPVNPFEPTVRDPHRNVWYRADGALPNIPWLHHALLAYASDFSFITTALLPHGVSWLTPGIRMSSLDHSMWFHRPIRMDDWLLHRMDSPSAFGGRALVRGQIFNEAGELVASTAQEGVIRLKSWRKDGN
jgi:acyl-CoA thioesterase II